MLGYVEYLGLPTTIGVGIIAVCLIINLLGEILEIFGKTVPEFVKMRKYFKRKKDEKEDAAQTLREVKQLLGDVNAHYSTDNITKRDSWMCWVNDRAKVYDDSIVEINKNLSDATKALQDNTRLTEEMFVQSSRDRIIDFAAKVGNENAVVSREEFHRIFKVHDKYERFLAERGMTNGEVDVAIRIIRESYEEHMRKHTFVEDIRGYN